MKFLSNYPAEVLLLIFLIITFIQSGIDKLLDWNGNISFIKEHFKNSPLKNTVPLLLGIILIVEIIAGVLMSIGVYELYTSEAKEIALLGVELSAIFFSTSKNTNSTATLKKATHSFISQHAGG